MIYPVDSVIQPLNNRGQITKQTNKHKNKHTNIQTGKQTSTLSNNQSSKQTNNYYTNKEKSRLVTKGKQSLLFKQIKGQSKLKRILLADRHQRKVKTRKTNHLILSEANKDLYITNIYSERNT